jgi:hypothetical protein
VVLRQVRRALLYPRFREPRGESAGASENLNTPCFRAILIENYDPDRPLPEGKRPGFSFGLNENVSVDFARSAIDDRVIRH